MKIILLQNIPALGQKNDVKDVRNGFARNFLLPRKLAEPATEQALRRITEKKTAQEKKHEALHERAARLAEQLKSLTLSFTIKGGTKGKAFGSVTATQIRDALAKQDVSVEKEWIILEEPIKTGGEKTVAVKLPHGLKAELRLMVIVES